MMERTLVLSAKARGRHVNGCHGQWRLLRRFSSAGALRSVFPLPIGRSLAERPRVLVVGDKPIDATMVAAYPSPSVRGAQSAALTIGYLNEGRDATIEGAAAAQLAAHCDAFDVVPKQGTVSSFEPITALIRELNRADT